MHLDIAVGGLPDFLAVGPKRTFGHESIGVEINFLSVHSAIQHLEFSQDISTEIGDPHFTGKRSFGFLFENGVDSID